MDTVKNRRWIFLICLLLVLVISALTFWIRMMSPLSSISLENFYAYDSSMPLYDTTDQIAQDSISIQHQISFISTHGERVHALLDLPLVGEAPFPVVMLLHGAGDRKEVDYIQAGTRYFLSAGYAVYRIDIDNHGQRMINDIELDLIEEFRYHTRDLLTQTVFDLRRSIDLLHQHSEIDHRRIGYYGVSLGGIIGAVFTALDTRVKAVVLAISGGNLNLIFGLDALDQSVLEYFSVIDPINFIHKISPRPLLMINAENDEVIPPLTSKLLFGKAEEPKEIIWYPTTHKKVPLEGVYPDGIRWFDKYMSN